MILITGSSGLVGTALRKVLDGRGIAWRPFDIDNCPAQDTCRTDALVEAAEGVQGIVHLAAVSRVVWAENDPQRTQRVNVDALDGLLRHVMSRREKPWVIFASSREVYGEQEQLPVAESAALLPMNTYARSKVAGERLMGEAREQGLLGQIVRFSNVFGSIDDHKDRVVPAFARTAAQGGNVRVDGAENTFDFTHISDVARGLATVCEAAASGEQLPPIHFLTGRGTTLGQLAELAQKHARHEVGITPSPSRKFDVSRFYGDASRARELLGWQAEVSLEEGFRQLVDDFADITPSAQPEECAVAAVGARP